MAEHLDLPTASTRFGFDFDPLFRLAALPFGVTPGQASLTVEGPNLFVLFGPWRVTTTVDNVAHVDETGPYALPKVVGPPHLSLRDRGLTFATNARRGLCLRFHEPVRGIDPLGLLRHPSLTVTLDDLDEAATLLRRAADHAEELEQQEHDALEGLTAAELRTLASEHGIERASSMKKGELVAALQGVAGLDADEGADAG